MGLFDFLKKKRAEKPTSQQSCNNVRHTATEPDVEHKPAQSAPKAASKPSVALSMEERYGKVSLMGHTIGNWDEVMVEYQKLEDEGFAEASVALGQLELSNRNKYKALEHFRKAASVGVAEGAWGCAGILGHDYIADVTYTDKEWYSYCMQAASGGCCDAMNELANMYNRQNDFLGEFYWYQMAAYYGHPQGYDSVAKTLKKYQDAGKPAIGNSIDGVRPKEVENAIAIFRCMTNQDKLDNEKINQFVSAAMDDDNEIMGLFIGHFFEEVVKMDGNAKLGYQLAAHNNSSMGMKCLADMLATGRGCERNMQAAFEWYKAAAEKYEKSACFVMGEFMRKQNPNLAAYFYCLAFRRGFEPAFERIQQLQL